MDSGVCWWLAQGSSSCSCPPADCWRGPKGWQQHWQALAGLQHLIFSSNRQGFGHCISRDAPFPSSVLPQLQQLTYLEIVGQCDDPAGLQQLQGLTRLLGLRLGLESCVFETSTLLGMTQLQRLELAGGFALGAQLLSHLQPLQQLTFLSLPNSYGYLGPKTPPAASFSALTASTKLQVLDISSSTLAPGSWQHMFPADRQLLHLRELNMMDVMEPSAGAAVAPACSSLVRCCPGLQSLQMGYLQYRAELLAPLMGLSSLLSEPVVPG